MSNPTFTSTLFNTLASKIGQTQTDIENAIAGSLPTGIATIVAQAIVNGGTVTYSSNSAVTLGALVNPFLSGANLPLPAGWNNAALETSSITFTYASGTSPSFALSATVSGTAAFVTLGNQSNLAWAATLSLTAAITNPGSSSASTSCSGDLSGSLTFAKVAYTATYTFRGGSQAFTATVTPTSPIPLSSLISDLGLPSVTIPSEVTPSLTALTMTASLASSNETLTFSASCQVGTSGTVDTFLALMDVGAGSGWVLILGAQLGSNIKLSSLPVIGSAFPSTLALMLDSALLLVSTGNAPNFIPPLPGWTSTTSSFAVTLQKGVIIGALLDLQASSAGRNPDPLALNLARVNNPPTTAGGNPGTINPSIILIEATVADPISRTSFTGNLASGTIYKYLLNFQLTITGSPFSVMLSSTLAPLLTFSSSPATVTWTVALSVTSSGVQGDVSATLAKPVQLGKIYGIWLNSIEGMLGIDFQQMEITAGVMAEITIGSAGTWSNNGPSSSLLSNIMPGTTTPAMPVLTTDAGALIAGITTEGTPDVDLALISVASMSLGTLVVALIPAGLEAGFANTVNWVVVQDFFFYFSDISPASLTSA